MTITVASAFLHHPRPRAAGSRLSSRLVRCALLALAIAAPGPATAQDALTVAARNAVALPSTATDQFGQSFTIAGLSGLTYLRTDQLGTHHLLAVMDNADTLIELGVTLAPDGAIQSATVLSGLRLDRIRDHEDITFAPSGLSVLICDETAPGLTEVRLSDGTLIAEATIPDVFSTRVPNFGFESLTARTVAVPGCAPARELWIANEEGLTVDAPLSTPQAGTVVRLLRFCVNAVGLDAPGPQFAYATAPMHGGPISGGRSGLVALVALPSGRLLALERSFAFNIFSPFQSRLYEIDFAAASDVSGFTSGLAGQTFTPVTKRLLYQGNQTNLEGLALGPRLPSGARSLLGIVDDGDPISVNRLVAFTLAGPVEAPCPADYDGSGAISSVDVSRFLNDWFADQAVGTLATDLNADGSANAVDVADFFNAYFASPPACFQ